MLAAVASLKEYPTLAASKLAADKAAIHDGNDDMPLNGPRIAVHHDNIVIEDSGIDHARAAYAKDKARRSVEP